MSSTVDNSNDHVGSVVLRAVAIAQSYRHEMVTLEHILAALLERAEVLKCLAKFSVDHAKLQDMLTEFLKGDTHERVSHPPIRTREFDVVIGRTLAYAQFHPRRSPTGLDVMLQLIQLPHEDSYAITQLMAAGLDAYKLKRYIAHGNSQVRQPSRFEQQEGGYSSDNEPNDKDEAVAYIKKYCTDLNELAKNGKIDPVIGRDSELQRISQIIARRTKNNVALVGEAGVGKTAIVEGLAHRIQHGDVPLLLRGCTIWSLDVGGLVAGTRFRGDFEERMKFLLKAFSLIADDEPVLFIDEIHTIMDAGSGNKGSLDASNLLKPALARGKLRCIGSTTDKDWRQHFEKDRALLRRFKKLVIDEPSIADSKRILRGLAHAYGDFHGVVYTEAALDAAVDLTAKYVHDGRLPDKAIDIIDEAGARQRITDGEKKSTLDVADIEAEVARVAHIPVQDVKEDESQRLAHLEDDLLAAVYGQDHAIKTLVNAALISRAGLSDPRKPDGCFLFVGPTGVGKTEAARQLAQTLSLPLIKFDMSEFMERHAVSKMIGSPPGYVGFGEGGAGDGLLINAVDSTPACVLLLDEIEKAHPDIFNILLQVMDDAKLTNSAGKTVSFRSVILIMTSNLGVAQTERHALGFVASEQVEIDEAAIKTAFSPEFRNRLDAVVPFSGLDRISIGKIVSKFIDQLRTMVEDRAISIEIDEPATKWLVEHGYDPVYGARPLARLISEWIKQPLSRMILFGGLSTGGAAHITVDAGQLVVSP